MVDDHLVNQANKLMRLAKLCCRSGSYALIFPSDGAGGAGFESRAAAADRRHPTGYHPLGDPMRLTQVLLNLVGNAVKFTREGVITVRVEMQSDAQVTLGFDAALLSVRRFRAGET
jgi:hypothetical protein